jgi:hypothetical protein
VTPGKFSNVLRWPFFYLLILPAYKSVLDTTFSCLTSDNSPSSTWHGHIIGRGFALEVPENAVTLVSLPIVVELPDDYVVIATRRNQLIVRTESQSIDTPITEIIKDKTNYLLFGMVVELMNAFPCSPAPNPDVPIVSTCSQQDI